MKMTKLFVLAAVMVTAIPLLSASQKAVVLDICPYPNLIGKVAYIVGTVHDVFGIDDMWSSQKAFKIPPLTIYMATMQYDNHSGTVYYVTINGLGYCLHESWLKTLDDQDVKE
jgi:hypothetical protein